MVDTNSQTYIDTLGALQAYASDGSILNAFTNGLFLGAVIGAGLIAYAMLRSGIEEP